MPRFSVSLAALASGVDDIAAGVERIEAQLGDLADFLAPLRATWGGEASLAWRHYQQLWDEAAADLRASLGTLHSIASTAHGNYTSAESANGRIWTV